MGKLKLEAAAGAPVSSSAAPLRRSQRLVAAAQIPASPPPRQAKRPPSRRRIQSPRGSNRRRPSSASAAALQKRNALCRGKRRFYFCANSPVWGAKRARSVMCCGGGDIKPVDPAPAQDADWANLGDGPAGLIADLLLANDVADYVRFRAVCHPWRRCSPDPRAAGLDRRFLPRQWVMIDKAVTASPRCHRFLNISTGECIGTYLPELDEHKLLAVTPEGLLLLLNEPTLVVRLLNPLTGQLTDLPPVTTLLTEHYRARLSVGEMSLDVYGVGLANDAPTVAVCFCDPRVLVVAKPGDEFWAVVYDGNLHSTVSCAGRFYCCIGMDVMVLNTAGSDRLLMAAKKSSSIHFSQMAHSVHLVDNAGELMLLHRSLYRDSQDSHKRKCEVYRVDLDAGTLVPAKSFDGRAVFACRYRAISVAAEAFPSVAADTLYLGFGFEERTMIGRYNLIDRSSKPIHKDSSVHMYPCSVIHCLSRCVWQMGNLV